MNHRLLWVAAAVLWVTACGSDSERETTSATTASPTTDYSFSDAPGGTLPPEGFDVPDAARLVDPPRFVRAHQALPLTIEISGTPRPASMALEVRDPTNNAVLSTVEVAAVGDDFACWQASQGGNRCSTWTGQVPADLVGPGRLGLQPVATYREDPGRPHPGANREVTAFADVNDVTVSAGGIVTDMIALTWDQVGHETVNGEERGPESFAVDPELDLLLLADSVGQRLVSYRLSNGEMVTEVAIPSSYPTSVVLNRSTQTARVLDPNGGYLNVVDVTWSGLSVVESHDGYSPDIFDQEEWVGEPNRAAEVDVSRRHDVVQTVRDGKLTEYRLSDVLQPGEGDVAARVIAVGRDDALWLYLPVKRTCGSDCEMTRFLLMRADATGAVAAEASQGIPWAWNPPGGLAVVADNVGYAPEATTDGFTIRRIDFSGTG